MEVIKNSEQSSKEISLKIYNIITEVNKKFKYPKIKTIKIYMAKDFLSDEADAEIKKQKERRKKEGIVLKRNPDKKREKELVQARLLS